MGGSSKSDSSDGENGEYDSTVGEVLRKDAVPYKPKHKRNKYGHKSYDDVDDSESTEGREPMAFQQKNKSHDAAPYPVQQFHSISIVGSNNVHIGNNFMVAKEQNVTDSSPKTPVWIERTTDVDAIMQSKEEVSDALLTDLSQKFGEGWSSVFKKMGLEECTINNVYETYFCQGVPEIIFQLLYYWRNAEDRKLGNLCSALWEAKRRDLVIILIDLTKPKCNSSK